MRLISQNDCTFKWCIRSGMYTSRCLYANLYTRATTEIFGAKCRSKLQSYFPVKYYSKQDIVRMT